MSKCFGCWTKGESAATWAVTSQRSIEAELVGASIDLSEDQQGAGICQYRLSLQDYDCPTTDEKYPELMEIRYQEAAGTRMRAALTLAFTLLRTVVQLCENVGRKRRKAVIKVLKDPVRPLESALAYDPLVSVGRSCWRMPVRKAPATNRCWRTPAPTMPPIRTKSARCQEES